MVMLMLCSDSSASESGANRLDVIDCERVPGKTLDLSMWLPAEGCVG